MKIIILTIIALLTINGCGGGATTDNSNSSDTTPTTQTTANDNTQSTPTPPSTTKHVVDDTPSSTVTPSTTVPTTKKSYDLSQINGSLSAIKYSGKGITIGVMDGGFDLANSEFDGIDIINSDYENLVYASSTQKKHGNSMLQTIGANQSGLVKGITEGASFVLGNYNDSNDRANEYSRMSMYGATVINNSWGPTSGYRNFIGDDVNSKIQSLSSKIVFVHSLGNNNTNLEENPHNLDKSCVGKRYIIPNSDGTCGTIDDDIILVGALNQDGTKQPFSNYGSSADVFVQDTAYVNLNGTVTTSNGTSSATAIVSSVVAMAQEANPSISPAKLMNLICSTATHIGSDPYDIVDVNGNMRSKTFGCGKLNVDAFISAVESEI